MGRRRVSVGIDIGLRARYAEDFVQIALRSGGPVTIGRVNGRKVDAKSMLLVLDLELGNGEEAELIGDDDQVLDELVEHLASAPPKSF